MAENFPLVQRLTAHLGRGSRSGDEIRYVCPFCHGSRSGRRTKRKLYVNIKKQLAHCWVCGYQGSVRRLFRDLNGGELLADDEIVLDEKGAVPKETLVQTVYRQIYPDPDQSVDLSRLKPEPIPEEAERLSGQPSLLAGKALKYLRNRGVTGKLIRRFDIHYAASGPYAGYLIFPIDQFGKRVYFATRYAGGAALKSKNPPKREDKHGNLTHHTSGTCLLGFDRVRYHRSAALVEGPFDAMAFRRAIAGLGKSLTNTQIDLIRQLVKDGLEDLIIALDSGAAEEAELLYKTLSNIVPSVRVMYYPDEGDPHEFRDQIRELCRGASAPTLERSVIQRLQV